MHREGSALGWRPHGSSACHAQCCFHHALVTWVGFVVTQSPVCASPASGTLHGLDSLLNRDSMTRSDFNPVQKCCLADTLGHQELSINHSRVPNGACYRVPLIDSGTARPFSLRGNLRQNHLRRNSEPTGGSVDTPQTCNPGETGLISLSAQKSAHL